MHTPTSLQEEFDRFIEFGNLLDRKTRRYLVQYLNRLADPKAEAPPILEDAYFRYFSKALDEIFAQEDLLGLLQTKGAISDQILLETLRWIRTAYREARTDHPFEEEVSRLQQWSISPINRWAEAWHVPLIYLTNTYSREQIDPAFYEAKFNVLLQPALLAEIDLEKKEAIELVIKDLLASWDALLSSKLLAFQLNRLDSQRKTFQDLLQAKASEFQRLSKLIQPFAEYTGRFWDLSRKLWENHSFDILEKYEELLKNEASVKELADLLGNMRAAEIELEEETFERVIVRKQWLEDYDAKSEIDGLRESDDLGAILSSEAAFLAEPDTETVFLKKFAEKSLLTFRYQDQQLVSSEHEFTETEMRVKQKEKGPFIICIDTSDSMRGKPEHIAKVLCFAILKMAAKENRRAFLINFSVGIKTLDLYDLANSVDQIAAFLQMSFRGGTDISPAMHEVLRQLKGENYQDADVLLISDFIMYKAEPGILKGIKYFQQNKGTCFYSLTLADDPPEEIIDIFDDHWIYDPEDAGIIRKLAHNMGEVNKKT